MKGRKISREEFTAVTHALSYEGKINLIKNQLTALTQLKRAYKKGEGLPDCPLCEATREFCAHCVWSLMWKCTCGGGWGMLLDRSTVALDVFREKSDKRVADEVAIRLEHLEEQRKELRSLLAYVEREEERRIKEWLSKSL